MDSGMQIKKYFFPLLILAIVLAAAFGLLLLGKAAFPPPASEASIAIEPPKDFDVQYTAAGYAPDFLEIPVGSRVTFHNVSELPMWTASDPHPIHSDFSPFDSQRDYLPGETYTFRFMAIGTFGFHNHEKSDHRGIVRVIDPANPIPDIDKTKESQREVRNKLLSMFQQNEPDSVFLVIDAIESNYALARDCHDMAHDLGHRAYELFGFSSAMTFNNPNRLGHTSVDDICAGGYIHGILEEVFLHQPQLKNHPADICISIPKNNQDSCFHGVGHGMMFVNKRNVPVSLTDCRQLGYQLDTLRCFEGVWMEMFWGDTSHAGGNSLGWTPEKPLAPCLSVRDDEKPACFLYAHLGFLRTHPRDFAGATKLCTDNGLVLNDKLFCIKGIGITMMKHFTSHHLEEAEKLVAGLSYLEKYAYYQGVIGYARLSGVSEVNLQQFCTVLQNDKDVCDAVIKNGT